MEDRDDDQVEMSRAPRPVSPWLVNTPPPKPRVRERTTKGWVITFCPPGRIIKCVRGCKHSFEQIIQPGDYERMKNGWLSHCTYCRGMITSEPITKRR